MSVREAMMTRTESRTQRVSRMEWVRPFVRDWSFTVGIVMLYFLARGAAPANPDFAMDVTRVLIDFEKATLTFWEPQIQELSIRFFAVKEFANFIYAYLHFPVLIAVGALLWFRDRRQFTFLRNTMFVSMVFGLLFYYVLPAAPPRLLALNGYDLGFVDTVFGGDTYVSYAQPSWILNEYAAIPSFHFGWIGLASAGIWVHTTNRYARAVAIVLSILMSWAIIASANHFWVDMAMGGAIVAIAWYIARRFERRQDARAAIAQPGRARKPRPTAPERERA